MGDIKITFGDVNFDKLVHENMFTSFPKPVDE